MTNPTNVEVITERMLGYLRTTHEDFVKKDIVAKITKLAERFSPNNIWFMKTMNEVFELEGNLVRPDVAHNLMRLIAEGVWRWCVEVVCGGDVCEGVTVCV